MVCLALVLCIRKINQQNVVHRLLCKTKRSLSNIQEGIVKNSISRILEGGEEYYREECDLNFPTNVKTVVGVKYYDDPTKDSGVYYQDTIPIGNIGGSGKNPSGIDLVPDSGDIKIDVVVTTTLDSYKPHVYKPVPDRTSTRAPDNTTAYVVTIVKCPDHTSTTINYSDDDPAEDIYEASAILNYEVCNATETAVAQRDGSNSQTNGRKLNANLIKNHTMYALIHPDAVNCPNPDGTTYNRVKLLQAQGYHVHIVGQPITKEDIAHTQPYIDQNIHESIRGTLMIHAFRLTNHQAVVVMSYDSQLQQPVQDEIDDLLADPNTRVKFVKDTEGGVTTSFMIIQPSMDMYNSLRQAYIDTPYSPTTGWNGEGTTSADKEKDMGCPGFLAYYASKSDDWQELDRCTYNNELDDECLDQMSILETKVAHHSATVCGKPRDCPYDHPLWSAEKRRQCHQLHRSYFMARFEFESKFLVKEVIQERIGMFKPESFLGYCKGPGKKNYLQMTQAIETKPDWMTICPPLECPPGSYMKKDCTCTFPGQDPCVACPSGTKCQRYPELRCLDCNCAFCDRDAKSCCTYDAWHRDCKAGDGNSLDCSMSQTFFPAFKGYGDVCSGVEIAETVTYNGCGCKPNKFTPCSYNPGLQHMFNHCYLCTVLDLLDSTQPCPDCKECLSQCPGGACVSTSTEEIHLKYCLYNIDQSCRASCNSSCKKQ